MPEPPPPGQLAASTAAGPPAPAAPPTPSVLVEFEVPSLETSFGDCVAVVGEAPELGAWDPQHGRALEWREGGRWTARAVLPPGEHSFKVGRRSFMLCMAAAFRHRTSTPVNGTHPAL